MFIHLEQIDSGLYVCVCVVQHKKIYVVLRTVESMWRFVCWIFIICFLVTHRSVCLSLRQFWWYKRAPWHCCSTRYRSIFIGRRDDDVVVISVFRIPTHTPLAFVCLLSWPHSVPILPSSRMLFVIVFRLELRFCFFKVYDEDDCGGGDDGDDDDCSSFGLSWVDDFVLFFLHSLQSILMINFSSLLYPFVVAFYFLLLLFWNEQYRS